MHQSIELILSSCLLFLLLWLFCRLWLIPAGVDSARSKRWIGWMGWQLRFDELSWRKRRKQRLIFCYPAVQWLIKRDEKLCFDTQGCCKNMGIFLSCDTDNCLLLSWSWYWCNDQWNREKLIPIPSQSLWFKVTEDVALGFCQHSMGDSTFEESSSTDSQKQIASARWRSGSCNQAGAIEKQHGFLINRHLGMLAQVIACQKALGNLCCLGVKRIWSFPASMDTFPYAAMLSFIVASS
jgi:hypothetical protein